MLASKGHGKSIVHLAAVDRGMCSMSRNWQLSWGCLDDAEHALVLTAEGQVAPLQASLGSLLLLSH